MMHTSSNTTRTRASKTPPPVLRHALRRRWGRAVMVWERADKRAFQFEDGALRIFKSGFYHLLTEVELADEEAERLAERLIRQAEREDDDTPATAAGSPVPGELAVAERLAWLRQRYPGDFGGERWQRELRHAVRRQRRHRDPIVAQAQARLVPDAAPLALAEALGALAGETDLVGPKIGPGILALAEADRARLGEGLAQLLQPEIPAAIRLERWLDRLVLVVPELVCWSLVTLPLALVAPQEHILVRRTMARREAALHGIALPVAPSAPVYAQLQGAYLRLRDALIAQGAPPKDLLDVYDFVRITLSPTAQRQLTG